MFTRGQIALIILCCIFPSCVQNSKNLFLFADNYEEGMLFLQRAQAKLTCSTEDTGDSSSERDADCDVSFDNVPAFPENTPLGK